MANKNTVPEKKYLVQIGRFSSEEAAVSRRSLANSYGLDAKIEETTDNSMSNIYAALLLIAEMLQDIKNSPIMSGMMPVQSGANTSADGKGVENIAKELHTLNSSKLLQDGISLENIAQPLRSISQSKVIQEGFAITSPVVQEVKKKEADSLGAVIAKYRELKNMSQSELGQKLGVSGATISAYERNINSIPTMTLYKLISILKIPEKEIEKYVK